MNRRDLLQSLSLLPALAPLVRLEESKTKPPTETLIEGQSNLLWKIKWHGWHQLPAQHALFGYWWARNEALKLQAAAPCPGRITYMWDAQMMDVSIQKDQILITPETSVLVAEEQQNKALENLILFLKTEAPPIPGGKHYMR